MKVIAESSLVSEEAAGVALVVDDEPGTRAAIARALKLIGFDVRTADSGAAGVALARGCALDLMLIDMRMPDMAGTEVVRLLREEGSDVPFIIMSGCLSTESVVESMKLGAFDVIEKPVSVDGLQ